jgi:hypothetical protein
MILANLLMSLAWWWSFTLYLSPCIETFLLVFSTYIIYNIFCIRTQDNLSLQGRGCGQGYKETGVRILAGMKNTSATQCLSRCCDSISSLPNGYRRLYSWIKGPRSKDDCAHPSAAEVNCLVLVTGAEVLCWLRGRSWIFRYCLDERHGLEWLSLRMLQLNRIGLYTGCVTNTWRFSKFENQRIRYAPLPYWPSSYTVMFGV